MKYLSLFLFGILSCVIVQASDYYSDYGDSRTHYLTLQKGEYKFEVDGVPNGYSGYWYVDGEFIDGDGRDENLWFADPKFTYNCQSSVTIECNVWDDEWGDDGNYIETHKWEITINNPPNTPYNEDPVDNAINVSVNTDLNWFCSDPDGDDLDYTIKWKESGLLNSWEPENSNTSHFDGLPTLDFDQTYKWKIIATDDNAETEGPKWSFTTEENNEPNSPTNPDPNDGKENVSLNTDLNWDGGDPDGDDVSYTVKVRRTGPTITSWLFEKNNVSSSYLLNNEFPEDLQYDEEYVWGVIAEDEHGETSKSHSSLWYGWRFTIEDETNEAPYINSFDPSNNNILVVNKGDDKTFSITAKDDNVLSKNQLDKVEWYLDEDSEGSDNLSGNQDTKDESITFLEFGNYTVKAVVHDEKDATDQVTWQVRVNQPPSKPQKPISPEDGAENVSINPSFTWSGGDDPEGDKVTYTFKYKKGLLGWNDSETDSKSFNLSNLDFDQKYYWKVFAVDEYGAKSKSHTVTENGWKFTTQKPGNLEIAVRNFDGSYSPYPGDNGIVKLWNKHNELVGDEGDQTNEGKNTNSTGEVTYTDMPPECGYSFKVFHAPGTTIFGKEYWGKKDDNCVLSDQTSKVEFIRNMPFATNIEVYKDGEKINGQTVSPNSEVTVKVTVKNNGSATDAKVRLMLDIDKSEPWNKDTTSNYKQIYSGDTQTFSFTCAFSELGDYYPNVAVYERLSGELTDGWDWTENALFTVRSKAIITNFQPPSETLSRGDETTASVTIKNNSNQKDQFWVGLSFAEPGAGDWPNGWYDVPPKESDSLAPSETQKLDFEFDIPWWMIPGDYKAVTAIWKGYNEEDDLMIKPRYDSKTSSSYNLNDYPESKVKSRRVYPPVTLNSLDYTDIPEVDKYGSFLETKLNTKGPIVNFSKKNINNKTIKLNVGITSKDDGINLVTMSGEEIDANFLDHIDHFYGYQEVYGKGASQIILFIPDELNVDSIKVKVDGKTTLYKIGEQIYNNVSLISNIASIGQTTTVGEGASLAVSQIMESELPLEEGWGFITDIFEASETADEITMDEAKGYVIDFDLNSFMQDYATFENTNIELKLTTNSDKIEPIFAVTDLRYSYTTDFIQSVINAGSFVADIKIGNIFNSEYRRFYTIKPEALEIPYLDVTPSDDIVPEAEFYTENSCLGETTQFIENSTNLTEDASFEWDIHNDGTIDYTGKEISHQFNSSGDYEVKLIVSQNDKTDSQIKTIHIDQTQADAGEDKTICQGESVTLNATGGVSYEWSDDVEQGVSFTPKETSTYTVTVTDENGCQPEDEVTVTVIDPPNVDAGEDFTVCEGESVTLNASGADYYEWDQGVVQGKPFKPETTTTYTVTGTNEAGCASTDDITVTVNKRPEISTEPDIQNSSCGNTNGSITGIGISGNSPFEYSWYNISDEQISTSKDLTEVDVSIYKLKVTGDNGCSNTFEFTVNNTDGPQAPEIISSTDYCYGEEMVLQALGSGGTIKWYDDAQLTELLSTQETYDTIAISSNDYYATETKDGCESAPAKIDIVVNESDINLPDTIIVPKSDTSVVLNAGAEYISYEWSNGSENQTITPSNFDVESPNIYSVSVKDQFGCEYTDTTSIIVLPYHTISLSAYPLEGGSVSGGGDYQEGTEITISATFNEGYVFDSWTENGNEVSTNKDYTFTVTEERNLTANFKPEYTLSLSADPSEGGSVAGGGTYVESEEVTIEAQSNEGYIFDGWISNGDTISKDSIHTFTLTQDTSLIAHFIPEYTVSLLADPSDGGEVSGGGTYVEGSEVTVEAHPNEDYAFEAWIADGDIISKDSVFTFTITQDTTLTVHFIPKYNVSLYASPSEGGKVSAENSSKEDSIDIEVMAEEEIIIKATPNSGYNFDNWRENDTLVTDTSSYTFSVKEDRNLTANFSEEETSLEDISFENGDIQVYPNPTKGNLTIEIKDLDKEANLTILNVAGKVIYEDMMHAGENRHKVNLSDYHDGIYFIRLRMGNTVYTKKVILDEGYGMILKDKKNMGIESSRMGLK